MWTVRNIRLRVIPLSSTVKGARCRAVFTLNGAALPVWAGYAAAAASDQ
jgi:hypothetical protein